MEDEEVEKITFVDEEEEIITLVDEEAEIITLVDEEVDIITLGKDTKMKFGFKISKNRSTSKILIKSVSTMVVTELIKINWKVMKVIEISMGTSKEVNTKGDTMSISLMTNVSTKMKENGMNRIIIILIFIKMLLEAEVK